MTKLESITDIRHTVFHLWALQNQSQDPQASLEIFQTAVGQLLDRIYSRNEDMIAPQQYDAAKQGTAHFMRLVNLAFHYHVDKSKEAAARDRKT